MPVQAAQAIGDPAHREGRVTWQVLVTRDDYELDAATIRREVRAAINAAGSPSECSLRELRHTFVSLMSDSGSL